MGACLSGNNNKPAAASGNKGQAPQANSPGQGSAANGNKSTAKAPAAAANEEKKAVMNENDAIINVEVRSVTDRYELKNKLGKGRYGTVRVCTEKATGRDFAVKIINGKAMKSESIINEEVVKLRKVGEHPNVVQLYDFFKDQQGFFYIVMEYCRGGDLFSRIVEDGSYTEARAAELLRQLASALVHIHSKGIVHRDLKPENILLSSKGDNGQVKIVDFGLSKLVQDKQLVMTTVIGTWAYCAPEVFEDKPYTNAVDTWALGILMFIMLAGYHPFDPYGELSDAQLIQRISHDEFNFDEPEWQGVSQEAKDIITRLLQKDPTRRMQLEEFLTLPWVRGEVNNGKDLTHSMKRFLSTSQRLSARPGGAPNGAGDGRDDE